MTPPYIRSTTMHPTSVLANLRKRIANSGDPIRRPSRAADPMTSMSQLRWLRGVIG